MIERNDAIFEIKSISVFVNIRFKKKNMESVSIDRSADTIWLSVREDIN